MSAFLIRDSRFAMRNRAEQSDKDKPRPPRTARSGRRLRRPIATYLLATPDCYLNHHHGYYASARITFWFYHCFTA